MDAVLQKMRDRVLAGQDISGLHGVEIGPLFRPLISKRESNVKYVDHCSTAELKGKYIGDPNVDPNNIVDVDFVWKDRPLKEVLGPLCPLDYIVASHVIEHVPDLVGWLEEMHNCLRPGGLLILIAPDKRFTFDVQRRTSSYEEVRAAYTEKRRRPGLRCVMDHFANVVSADCYALWENYAIASDLPFCHGPAFLELAAKHYDEGRYIDVHCWVFTPWSFLELVGRAVQDTNLGFDLEYFRTTFSNDLEFYARLVRTPSRVTNWSREAEQARALAVWPNNSHLMVDLLK
jgi:SAM-dependent methyltransferase